MTATLPLRPKTESDPLPAWYDGRLRKRNFGTDLPPNTHVLTIRSGPPKQAEQPQQAALASEAEQSKHVGQAREAEQSGSRSGLENDSLPRPKKSLPARRIRRLNVFQSGNTAFSFRSSPCFSSARERLLDDLEPVSSPAKPSRPAKRFRLEDPDFMKNLPLLTDEFFAQWTAAESSKSSTPPKPSPPAQSSKPATPNPNKPGLHYDDIETFVNFSKHDFGKAATGKRSALIRRRKGEELLDVGDYYGFTY